MREATVGHLLRGEGRKTEILLGQRDSLFCGGVWSGPGGKFDDGEDAITCLARELREEIGVRIDKATTSQFATLNCHFPKEDNGALELQRVHFFCVRKWRGEPQPLEGFASLKWFSLHELPYDLMHPDRLIWLPAAVHTPERKLEVDVVYGDSKLKTVVSGAIRFV